MSPQTIKPKLTNFPGTLFVSAVKLQGWQSTIITTGTCTTYTQGPRGIEAWRAIYMEPARNLRVTFIPLFPVKETCSTQYTISKCCKHEHLTSTLQLEEDSESIEHGKNECEEQITLFLLPREYPHRFQRICGPHLGSSLSPFRASWKNQQTALCSRQKLGWLRQRWNSSRRGKFSIDTKLPFQNS